MSLMLTLSDRKSARQSAGSHVPRNPQEPTATGLAPIYLIARRTRGTSALGARVYTALGRLATNAVPSRTRHRDSYNVSPRPPTPCGIGAMAYWLVRPAGTIPSVSGLTGATNQTASRQEHPLVST